jgi:hypothetical protein
VPLRAGPPDLRLRDSRQAATSESPRRFRSPSHSDLDPSPTSSGCGSRPCFLILPPRLKRRVGGSSYLIRGRGAFAGDWLPRCSTTRVSCSNPMHISSVVCSARLPPFFRIFLFSNNLRDRDSPGARQRKTLRDKDLREGFRKRAVVEISGCPIIICPITPHDSFKEPEKPGKIKRIRRNRQHIFWTDAHPSGRSWVVYWGLMGLLANHERSPWLSTHVALSRGGCLSREEERMRARLRAARAGSSPAEEVRACVSVAPWKQGPARWAGAVSRPEPPAIVGAKPLHIGTCGRKESLPLEIGGAVPQAEHVPRLVLGGLQGPAQAGGGYRIKTVTQEFLRAPLGVKVITNSEHM